MNSKESLKEKELRKIKKDNNIDMSVSFEQNKMVSGMSRGKDRLL